MFQKLVILLALPFVMAATPAPPASGEDPGATRVLPLDQMRPLVDHPGVLQSGTKEALEKLLAEHLRLTGERIVFAVLRSSSDVNPREKAKILFESWNLNSGKTRGSSILLVFFWKEREARIEIGYGMDAVFSSKEGNRIISDFLLPDTKASGPNRALSLTLFELLRTLDSPLIVSGEAERVLRGAGFTGPWAPQEPGLPWIWILGVPLCGGVFAALFYLLKKRREAREEEENDDLSLAP